MKKIGIFTITDYLNYGNRLQNYAAQEILKMRGYDVVSIGNRTIPPKDTSLQFLFLRVKNAVFQSPVAFYLKVLEKISERKNQAKFQAGQKAKEQSFRLYSSKYLVETEYTISVADYPENLSDQFDYFVVGSDQIWNPTIRYGSALDFLTFAPIEKRVALAPSFGVSDIPDNYKDKYRQWLNEMQHISVREEAGAKIIRDLTGKTVPVLVDPTLMLSREDWLKVSEKAKNKPSKAYLLTYFIGKMSETRKRILNKLAADNNLELIMMASLNDIDRYDANPGEFIDYVNSAALICTDSFHATIFSMLMERPFVVFDREGKSAPMSSRIDTLLSKFKFENRKYKALVASNNFFKIDFSHVDEIVKGEKEKVHKFLDKALK